MKTVTTVLSQFIFILFSSCVLIPYTYGKDVDGLYETSVPVADQTDSKRRLATTEALSEIVVRISGQSNATENEVLQTRLEKASAYIQRYKYREVESTDGEGKVTKQLILDLFFDEMALRDLLKEAELPRWGANRPEVLAWIAIGDTEQRFLVSSDNESKLDSIINRRVENTNNSNLSLEQDFIENIEGAITDGAIEAETTVNVMNIIDQQAKRRGLPLMTPLMDLEDAIAINVEDVWGRFVNPIRQASYRYEPDGILAAQIMKVGGSWQTRWLLLHQDRTLSWEQTAETIEEALSAGIDETADRLARQYAVYEDSLQTNELLISVSNIERLEDYALLMDYLKNLTSVHTVNIAKVSGATLYLKLNLLGRQDAMLQAISLDNRLFLDSESQLEGKAVMMQLPALYFRWNSDNSSL